jgi:hypothetical protein
MNRLLLIIILSLLCLTVGKSQESIETDTQANAKLKIKTNYLQEYPWSATPFLSAGYGYPQGFRAETGYTFGYLLTLGMSFGIGDTWSRDPGEGTLAFLGRLNIPFENTSLGMYISIISGGSIAIFGEPDTYTVGNLGMIVPLAEFLVLRPELGVAFVSKHISGGHGLFGSSPEVREDNTFINFNVVLELDLRPLLWKTWKM